MALSGKDRQRAYMRRLREPSPPSLTSLTALVTRIEQLERVVYGSSLTKRVPNGSLRKGFSLDSLPKESPSLTSLNLIRSLDEEFEELWPLFPRKIGKGGARRAYRTARKKAAFDVVSAGIRKLAIEHQASEAKFIPHPATWLNQERWLDEPVSNGSNGHIPLVDPVQLAEIEDIKRRVRESFRDRENLEP